MTQKKNPIGEINGFHAALFKLNMILIPVMVAALLSWGAWVTVSLVDLKSFAKYGERFSAEDARNMERGILEYVSNHFIRR